MISGRPTRFPYDAAFASISHKAYLAARADWQPPFRRGNVFQESFAVAHIAAWRAERAIDLDFRIAQRYRMWEEGVDPAWAEEMGQGLRERKLARREIAEAAEAKLTELWDRASRTMPPFLLVNAAARVFDLSESGGRRRCVSVKVNPWDPAFRWLDHQGGGA